MTQLMIPKISARVYKYNTYAEKFQYPFLQNTHDSFSIKPNQNNCVFEMMLEVLIWKDRNFVFRVQ